MKLYGLTGGIACGKSTAARLFGKLGAVILDADRVAREVVLPGTPAFGEIVKEFGREILAPDGTLDRPRLGGIVFADEEKRRKLNAITHPRIAAETGRRLAALASGDGHEKKLVLYEASLIVELGRKIGAGLIVVTVRPEAQLRRLMERDGIGAEEARRKISAQMPLEEKAAAADYLIDNSGNIAQMEEQVKEIWREIAP